ncbi:anti-sigma-I factor RsgI family protein [Fusibacter sp. JL298sf-3]
MKRMKGIVIGAVIAAGMLIGVPTYMSSQAVHTTVTVDINPSVALSLNKNDKVVQVEAINEDAKSLALQTLKGLSIEEAAERLIDQAEDKGFISDDDDAVILITAVDAKPKSGPEAQAVLEKISKDVQQGTVLEKVEIALQVADQETLERALKEALPLGLVTLDDTVESGTKVMDFVRDETNRVLLENNVLLLTEDELDLDDADDDLDDADDDLDDADDDLDDADDDLDDADDDLDDADDDLDDVDDDLDDADDDLDDADDDSDDADDDSDDDNA